jgi:hypothetical protein
MNTICQMRPPPAGIDFFDSLTERTYNVQVANSIGNRIAAEGSRETRTVATRSPQRSTSENSGNAATGAPCAPDGKNRLDVLLNVRNYQVG